MEKLDLWGNIEENNDSAAAVLELLVSQADLLTQKTNGKIVATFDTIKYRYVSSTRSSVLGNYAGITTALGTLSSAILSMPEPDKKEEVIENSNLENAAALYKEKDYKFEICSEKYRYRIFTLNYSPTYPITINVEFGILDDKLISLTINSLEEAKDKISEIFTSRKVKYILNEMLKEAY